MIKNTISINEYTKKEVDLFQNYHLCDKRMSEEFWVDRELLLSVHYSQIRFPENVHIELFSCLTNNNDNNNNIDGGVHWNIPY